MASPHTHTAVLTLSGRAAVLFFTQKTHSTIQADGLHLLYALLRLLRVCCKLLGDQLGSLRDATVSK